MKLIDADALLAALRGLKVEPDISQMIWSGDVESVVQDARAVDAIPVEWLEKQASEEGPYSIYCQAALEILLDDWQKEQEAQDGGHNRD